MSRRWLVIALAAVAAWSFVPTSKSAWAAAAADPDAIGWRVTWVATRDDGSQRVRVKVTFVNGSTTDRFDGDCRIKAWNRQDSARRTFPVRLAPEGSAEFRFRVVLDGRSTVRADVVACRPS